MQSSIWGEHVVVKPISEQGYAIIFWGTDRVAFLNSLKIHRVNSWCVGRFRDLCKIFVADVPGFVVQRVQKEMIVWNSTLSEEEKRKKDYYEIFYIDETGLSVDGDGFVQQYAGPHSGGAVTIIGESFFYPYGSKVEFDGQGHMIITPRLQRLFGKDVHISFTADANGLPYSETQPLMGNLRESNTFIRHTVWGDWQFNYVDYENETNQTRVTERLRINDKRESFGRPKDYVDEPRETKYLG